MEFEGVFYLLHSPTIRKDECKCIRMVTESHKPCLFPSYAVSATTTIMHLLISRDCLIELAEGGDLETEDYGTISL